MVNAITSANFFTCFAVLREIFFALMIADLFYVGSIQTIFVAPKYKIVINMVLN